MKNLYKLLPVILLVAISGCSDDKETIYIDNINLRVSPVSITADYTGGEYNVAVATNTSSWKAVSSDSWAIVKDADEQQGTFILQVEPSDQEGSRTAVITVIAQGADDAKMTVSQTGANSGPGGGDQAHFLIGKWNGQAYFHNAEEIVEWEFYIAETVLFDGSIRYVAYGFPSLLSGTYPIIIMLSEEDENSVLIYDDYRLGAYVSYTVYQKLGYIDDTMVYWVTSPPLTGTFDGSGTITFNHTIQVNGQPQTMHLVQWAYRGSTSAGAASDFASEMVLKKRI